MRTLVLIASIALTALGAHGEPPTNASIVAAIPPAVEGVKLARLDPLLANGSCLKPMFEYQLQSLVEESDRWGDEDSLARIRGLLAVSSPRVRCLALSDFGPPPDGNIGAGRVTMREIWAIDEPKLIADRLAHMAEHAPGVTRIRVAQRHAYLLEPSGRRPGERYVCVLEEGLYVEAPTLVELQYMVGALLDADAPVSARWKDVTEQVELESPLVLLRYFPDDKPDDVFSPANPRLGDEALAPTTVAYTLEDPARRHFQSVIRTDQPEKFCRLFGDTTHGTFRSIEDEPGQRKALFVLQDPVGEAFAYDTFTVMLMLGWYIAI